MFEKIKDLWRRVRTVVFDKGTIKSAIREVVAVSDEMVLPLTFAVATGRVKRPALTGLST